METSFLLAHHTFSTIMWRRSFLLNLTSSLLTTPFSRFSFARTTPVLVVDYIGIPRSFYINFFFLVSREVVVSRPVKLHRHQQCCYLLPCRQSFSLDCSSCYVLYLTPKTICTTLIFSSPASCIRSLQIIFFLLPSKLKI